MTIKFNYKRRDNGAKVAKVAITFVVERDDIVRAVWTVLGERLEDDYGYIDKQDYLTYDQIPATGERLSRASVERQIRSDLQALGTLVQESADYELGSAYIWDCYDSGDLANAARPVVEATVDRLFPEVAS